MIDNKLPALDLTLVIGCKIDCHFCPQQTLVNRYYEKDKARRRKMRFSDFKVALGKVKEGATIGFAGMAEPFLNDECADMIVYADKMGYKVSLYTTLVGMSMQDFEKIRNIKFDRLVLHIPDGDNLSKFPITDEYIEVFDAFIHTMEIDFYSCHGTVHPAIEHMIDAEKNAGLNAQNRAGNLEIEGLEEIECKGQIVCYRAWSSAAMNVSFTPELFPDGTLLLCCQDYGMKHQLGNLIEQSWDEIMNGEEFQRFLRGLKDDSIDILCRKCVCAKTVEMLPPMQLRSSVEDYRETNKDDIRLSEKVASMVRRFASASNICVFGVGKLFQEHFAQEYWDKGLRTNLLSDNNNDLHGKKINGIQCVSPKDLVNYNDLLVVIFVKRGCMEIKEQLKDIGIENCLTIDEVLDTCNILCREKAE